MRQDILLLLFLASTLLVHSQDLSTLINTSENFDSSTPTPINTIDATTQAAANLRAENQQKATSQATGTTTATQSPPQQQQLQPKQNPTAPTPTVTTPGQAPSPALPTNTQQQLPSQPISAQASGTIQQPKILLTQVQHPIVSKGFKIDQGISYQRIKVGELKKKYLFFNFNLAEKDKWQQVNLTITNEGSSIILNKCQYKGIDDCFVPSFALKPETILFVHVQCQDDCTYNLNAQWSDTQHLKPGDQVIFMFGKDTTQIYHVQLEEDQEFEEVRIHLAPRVTRKPFDNVKIYGKFGAETAPTPEIYDFKSVNLWQDGQGIFLKKSAIKQKKFILLIVGQAETTYRLSMQLVQKATHQIQNGQHIYEYIEAKSQKIYHVKSIPDVFDQYSLRFSVLSGGQLEIGYFTDKDLKNKLEFEPFQYMKDSEYILDTTLLDPKKDGLYVRVKTQARDATYAIKFIGRTKTQAIQLSENVYGFIQVLNQSKFAHFDFKRWAQETQSSSKLRFTVYMIAAAGKIKPQFFVCQSTLTLCTNANYYKNATVPVSIKTHDDVSQKQVYQLQIEDKVLKKINAAEQQTTIIVKLNPINKPEEKTPFNLAAIEFVNNNKVLYLREGRPLEEKMTEKDMKIYKFINSDPNVQEIRIHINEISGHVLFSGFIQTPDPANTIQVFAEANTLRFTKNLTLPIYVSVNAQTKSIFGISMQVIHKSQQNKNINIATISEDVAYTVKIQPNTYSIYEVVPIFYDFSFSYSSSQSIIVCPLNPETNSCIDPKGQPTSNPNLATKGEITKAILKDRKAFVKITNPFSDSIAEVSFIFHSRKFDHCDDRKIGEVLQQTVKDNSCISYSLPNDDKTIDLYISKREFASLTYRVLICGNLLANASMVKTLEITPQVIQKLCYDRQGGRKISIIWSVSTKNIGKQERSVKVDLLAQYRGDVVVLSEGVSHNRIVKIQDKDSPVGKFAYNLINKKDTKIVVNQIRGRFKVYAKLVQQAYRNTDGISNINYHFLSSQTVDYSQAPTILIRESDLKKEWCIDCAILIAVYTEEDRGKEVQFDIQIVQRYNVLNEDSAVEGYLEAGSFAYYTFNARSQDNSTILFLISDHNQQCANMYLAASQNPGPSNNLAKTVGENELIFRHSAGERKYYISVEAVRTCDYTLSVLTVDSSIHNIKRGKQNLIKFPQGVVKYFSLDHYTNQPFKLISLTKYGDINIYLNQSSLNVDRKSFTTLELALDKFTFKSQHRNTLAIGPSHPQFCQKCTYFIAIQALTNTQATLYLVYPQTTITLTQAQILSDYLDKKGDYTLATYHRVEKTQINVKLFTGTLNITAFYKQKAVTQAFQPHDGIQSFTIDMQSTIEEPKKTVIPQADPNLGKKSNETQAPAQIERIPINFIISAGSDNVSYTLELKSLSGNNINQLATYQTLIAGQPNPISVTNSKPVCLTGYLRDPEESIILSANNDNRSLFKSLLMEATLSGEGATVSRKYFRNILGINIQPKISNPSNKNQTKNPEIDERKKYTGTPYELCLKLLDSSKPKELPADSVTQITAQDAEETIFKASITQANTVNILPSDIQSVVVGENIFVIHSQGEFLLDVFQCQDEAMISIGNSLQNIEKQKLKVLDMVNMPDQRHAIRVSQKQTTFVKIKSKHSIVKWMPIDYEAERGLGYIKFSSGDLRYSSKFKELSVEYQPLKQLKQTKATIKEISYRLYVSNNTDEIVYSSQCAIKDPEVLVIPLDSPALQKSKQTEYLVKTIEKEILEERYPNSENIYFNVVCDLTLTVPAEQTDKASSQYGADEHEHYRFIYSRQQVPLASYHQSQIQSIPYHYLILLLVCIAAVLVLFTYLFTRKIVPMLARLRSSNLVEEEVEKEHKDDLEVPASSDRNQRAPDIALEEEKPEK